MFLRPYRCYKKTESFLFCLLLLYDWHDKAETKKQTLQLMNQHSKGFVYELKQRPVGPYYHTTNESWLDISELLSRNFCYRVECFRMLTTVDNTETNIHTFPIDILNVPMLVATKDKLLKNYYRTLRLAKDVVTRVFCPGLKQDAMDPRQLSPSAKMAVRYLSEIIAYDIGTPSGYSRMGPIMASIMNQDCMKGIGISFPVNGTMLQQHEKDKTCLSHGLDPTFWSLSQSQSIEEQIRLAMGLTSEGHDGTTTKLDEEI